MRSEEFLQLYRVLEGLLDVKYARSKRTVNSVIMEYMRDECSLPYRDSLNLCREVRNILSHNAQVDGSPVVEPSQALLDQLREIVESVSHPLGVLTFATPASSIMTARYDYMALRLMRDMLTNGFSHVPVLDGERFLGIFSVSTIFSYLAAHPGAIIDETTRVKMFRAFLPAEKHVTERFLFLGPDNTYVDVKHIFEQGARKRKRIAALFITDTGDPRGKLLGLVTPWDVLGKVQDGRTLIMENQEGVEHGGLMEPAGTKQSSYPL